LQDLRDNICNSSTTLGAKLLTSAFTQGGEQAQAALTIAAVLTCPSYLDPDGTKIYSAMTRALLPK